jgi:hypothetical protein
LTAGAQHPAALPLLAAHWAAVQLASRIPECWQTVMPDMRWEVLHGRS